jgi:hypothetical protein
MKKYLILLLCFIGGLFFSSCTTFYYSAVRSFDNQIPQNEDGTFSVENNNISVTYLFGASDGRIVYEINNQSDDPIFVDWSRSVLIAEDYAVQYRSNNARIDGIARTFTTTYRFTASDFVSSASHSDLTGQIVFPQNELFIPPRSRVSHSPLALSSVLNLDISSHLFERQSIGIGAITANVASFSEDNTPLKFRSYLTIINDRDGSQTVFEDTFFVSEIIRAGSRNDFLTNQANNRGDRFYIRVGNRAAQGFLWGVVAVGGLVLLYLVSQMDMPAPLPHP